ncbi:MAG: ATP synthase subunit I [Ruminococcaceae bacterium]|nr:ATP synthase subunit I [Oscillospiraceae bacterium]
MKIKNAAVRETVRIAIGEVVVLLLMYIVFFLVDHFDRSVVLGGLLGAFCNILYFFLMCMGLNSALAQPDQKKQKKSMTVSYFLRLVVLGIGIAIGLKMDCFNNIAVVVPVLMTRPIIAVLEYFHIGVREDVVPSCAVQQSENETDGDWDE